MTDDEMVGWHHHLNGHDFEQDLGDGEGQGSLGCCSPWRHKELDTTQRKKTTAKNLLITPIPHKSMGGWYYFCPHLKAEGKDAEGLQVVNP